MNNKIVSLLCLALIAFSPFPAAPANFPEAPDTYPTEFLSIPAAAFLPMSQDYDYKNLGYLIEAYGGEAKFRAPVILPNYSTLVSLTACFYDDTDAASGTLKMYDALLSDATDITEMASVTSLTTSVYTEVSDSSIVPVANNNAVFTYWLALTLPAYGSAGNRVSFCGATLKYQRSRPSYNAISIPGAAFDRPFEDGYNGGHVQSGGRLVHFDRLSDSEPGTYTAQISLPDGAKISKVSFYFQDDNDSEAIDFFVQRSAFGVNTTLASASSTDAGYKVEDTSVTNPTVDNAQYSYWAYVYLPATNLSLWAMVIEYTPPTIDGDVLAISNAAFTAETEDYDYENHGRWLYHMHAAGGANTTGIYSAPVQLPQGARIDSILFTFYDGGAARQGSAFLSRVHQNVSTNMGGADSTGSNGYTTESDESISNPIIDNENYQYIVQWYLPGSTPGAEPGVDDVVGVRMLIFYTSYYNAYLPTVRK